MFFPFIMMLIPITVLVIALLLASRVVRAFERRSNAPGELAELRERLHALEETVAAQEQSLNRLAEGQQFTERLLTERAGEGPAAAQRPSSSEGRPAMDRSDFVDENGTSWRIFDGLPSDYPDTGDRASEGRRTAGLTFRSSTGEVRVLPKAAIPHRFRIPSLMNAPGTPSPVAREETLDWRELLERTVPWPPR